MIRRNFSQGVLATDGNASFAFLLYENETICSLSNCVAGFDAGDAIRSTVVNDNQNNRFLQEKYIFRIDGKT